MNFAIDNSAPAPAAHLVVSPSADQLADLMLTRAFLGAVEIISVNTRPPKNQVGVARRASVPNQEQCLYPLHDREQQQELLPRCCPERIPVARGPFVYFLGEPCTQATRLALIGKTCQHPKCFSSYRSCGKRSRRIWYRARPLEGVVAIRQDLNSPAIVHLVFEGGVKATFVL